MRYAVIGTGWIADAYIRGAALTGNWELAAVYSRREETGRKFAEKYGEIPVYTDLAELAASDIPAVYIASPNALHYGQSKQMLEAGKHVICEKPVTVTPAGCTELQKLAAEKGLIYMEAIMMLHLPQQKLIRETLPKLGRITSAHFDFSQLSSKYPAYLRGELPNIFNPEMATGCLMDLGIYCIYPALAWFGEPEKLCASASFLPTGADESFACILTYPDKLVTVNCSKTGQDLRGSEIIGDSGTLAIQSISCLTGVTLGGKGQPSETLVGEVEKEVLMSGEAADFYRYITAPEESAAEYRRCSELALSVSRVMYKIRQESGIKFKEELL